MLFWPAYLHLHPVTILQSSRNHFRHSIHYSNGYVVVWLHTCRTSDRLPHFSWRKWTWTACSYHVSVRPPFAKNPWSKSTQGELLPIWFERAYIWCWRLVRQHADPWFTSPRGHYWYCEWLIIWLRGSMPRLGPWRADHPVLRAPT